MEKFICVILIFMNLSCMGQNRNETLNIPNNNSNNLHNSIKKDFIETLDELKLESDVSKSYELVKNSIENIRHSLKNKELSKDSLSNLFKHLLVNRIIPFWEGTEWSFEGHTSIPKKGKIACGYFVSTTLKDVGININKYRLAQQSPINEATSLALNSRVIEITGNSVEKNISIINRNLKEGIYFIGFDSNHVGYILKENSHLYLIHSNYINYEGVKIERIEKSEVFASYNKFYIVEISTNEVLLENWIKGIQIQVMNSTQNQN